MLFATVLTWLLVAAAFVISLPALWLLARALWPQTALKQREAASRGLFISFLLGLIPLIGGVALIAIVSKIPKAGAASILIGGVILAWGFIGAGGIATLIGERLWPALTTSEPWRQTMRGGVTMMCCALLPVVGWAFILPLIAILGWGINMRAWFVKVPVTSPALTPPPMPADITMMDASV